MTMDLLFYSKKRVQVMRAKIEARTGIPANHINIYCTHKIDPKLRPREENILYPTNENMKHYSDMIDDKTDGGIDYFTAGPGWAGHIAFIAPCPELIHIEGDRFNSQAELDEYLQQPPRS